MARLTGKAGAAVLASDTISAILSWEYEATSNNIETPASGDTATDRTHLRTDYTATIRMPLSVTPPYNVHTDLVGTEIAFELKILASDANGIVEDTGLVESARITHDIENATVVEVVIKSSDGSANPAYDESPAS